MYYTHYQSPIGQLLLVADEQGLRMVEFRVRNMGVGVQPGWQEDPARLTEAIRELDEYFAGGRSAFSIRLVPRGTPFQLKVLGALQQIPYGETRSYGDIARTIGHPLAARAVGAANRRNPIAIIIPCHRVIGSAGDLVGFGGGLAAKQFLLDLEHGHRSRLQL